MSFGGASSAMITSLKNNKRERPSAFKKIEHFKNSSNEKIIINKKATEKQLQEIKQAIQKENNKLVFIKISFFIIFISIFLYLVGFYKY